ncbi:hypothetical protein Q0Z83_009320 [Actinoplanes sichuanensis]|uniref:Uncharacterized protein n=1 Tax=Actinoplanes sichuanensis TaxID=512349 RepID=A0ABW4AF96_9ACTN|nr:hypothetical protein [Actinoplanes sichuanensis]BEL02741.1 hypothetical protein Q0Z83_009320 [Actinoplanes sichuanensis]
MNADDFPVPPIDREAISRIRAELRRHIRDAPPATDAIVREMQENILNGARGRDLLQIEAYREHFAAHGDRVIQRFRRLREDFDRERGRTTEEDC